MVASDFLTTRQVGEILGQHESKIRRVVDSLGGVAYFGGKRVIPRAMLPEILDAIFQRKNEPAEQSATP